MKYIFVLFLGFWISFSTSFAQHQRWSTNDAQRWSKSWGWLRGANFQPSTAVNQLEMFQAETFDTLTIDRELGWAENIGMNCMRVFLHHVAWENDKEGFKNRLEKYLEISWKHKIGTIFVFFDDCWNRTYKAGVQPEPRIGIHNSGWVRDPGDLIFSDSLLINTLESYVKDVMSAFSNDKRIVMWDLYNEPGNNGLADRSLPLLKSVFKWGREVGPIQPLTAGIWAGWLTNLNRFQLNNSDIITYHNYEYVDGHKNQIDTLKQKYGRPLICTEYMARTKGSLFQTILPLLKDQHVGAINWGLVSGKTNTIYAWDAPMQSGEEPSLWFHDVFRKDGSPFSKNEVETIMKLTGKVRK